MARMAYLAAGHVCLTLGIIGAFLPVMPTVVFLIGAAACYARGSATVHNRLLADKWLGPPIKDWEQHRTMTVKSKVLAITMLLLGIGGSVVFFAQLLWLRITLVAIAVAISVGILFIKTRRYDTSS
jgi:uncharacterized membrane protein YbaN (DUF454 family)